MKFKQLLASGGMLVFVAAVVVGGTGAFFSDTETSEGNVFTAGSVSINLLDYTHEWLGEEGAINEDDSSYFQTILSDGNLRYQFNDLKPGDFGEITKVLENGANDAFWCARNSVTSDEQPFIDMLKLQVNDGTGVTVNAFYDVPFNQWYSLDSDDTTSPFDGALAVDADETEELKVRYCFGEFDGDDSCVVNNPLDGDYWNQAQNQEITVDVEFFAIQQRNNENFTCGDLNEPVET